MTVRSKAAIKAFVCAGDRPTETQFGDLIDSYQDRQSALDSFGSAAAQAFPAIVVVGASAPDTAVTAHHINTAARHAVSGAGTGFHVLSSAVGTAGLTNALGVKDVGSALFVANTTASAQNQLGAGAIGVQLYEANTTASAQNFMELSRATTAQAANGTKVTAYMTPDNVRFNPFAARAYAVFTSAGVIHDAQRVSSVSNQTAGHFLVKWAPALPTTKYGWIGGVSQEVPEGGASNAIIMNHVVSAGAQSVSAMTIGFTTEAGVQGDFNDYATIAILCSGT